jgi:hypothetical protein
MVERRTDGEMTTRAKRAAKRAAAPRWMLVRVTLCGQGGEELAKPPRRDLLVRSSRPHRAKDLPIDIKFRSVAFLAF